MFKSFHLVENERETLGCYCMVAYNSTCCCYYVGYCCRTSYDHISSDFLLPLGI